MMHPDEVSALELLQDVLCEVAGNRQGDALKAAGVAADGGVDADDFARQVDQRSGD